MNGEDLAALLREAAAHVDEDTLGDRLVVAAGQIEDRLLEPVDPFDGPPITGTGVGLGPPDVVDVLRIARDVIAGTPTTVWAKPEDIARLLTEIDGAVVRGYEDRRAAYRLPATPPAIVRARGWVGERLAPILLRASLHVEEWAYEATDR